MKPLVIDLRNIYGLSRLLETLSTLIEPHEKELNAHTSSQWTFVKLFISLLVSYDNWVGIFSVLFPKPTTLPVSTGFSSSEFTSPIAYLTYKFEKITPELLNDIENFVKHPFPFNIVQFLTNQEVIQTKVFSSFLYHSVLETSHKHLTFLSSKYTLLLKRLKFPQRISNSSFMMNDYEFSSRIFLLLSESDGNFN